MTWEHPKMFTDTQLMFPMLQKLGRPLWVKASGRAGDGEFLLDIECDYFVRATRGFDTEVDPRMFNNIRTSFRDCSVCVRFVASVECDEDEMEETGLEYQDIYYMMEYIDIEKAYLKIVHTEKAYFVSFLQKNCPKLYTDLIHLIVRYTTAPEKIPRDILVDVWGDDYPLYPES